MTPCKYCGKEHNIGSTSIPSCVDVKITQLEQQNAALREAVRPLILEVRRMAAELFKGTPEDRKLCEAWFYLIRGIELALSLTPTTQDWVKKEDVRVIVEASLKYHRAIEHAPLGTKMYADAYIYWCEALEKAKQLRLERE